ncbi:DNA topoisomerase 1-like, partial [Musca vetustissima]|uniref:DNA topoisomerase 1-like n=1 Tax=Musca vetustissima TaxID=27455 RepID=UPI002AB6CB60
MTADDDDDNSSSSCRRVVNEESRLENENDLGTSETETTKIRNGHVDVPRVGVEVENNKPQITRKLKHKIDNANFQTIETAKKKDAVEEELPSRNINKAARGNVQQMKEPDPILKDKDRKSGWEDPIKKIVAETLKAHSETAENTNPTVTVTGPAVGATDGCPAVQNALIDKDESLPKIGKHVDENDYKELKTNKSKNSYRVAAKIKTTLPTKLQNKDQKDIVKEVCKRSTKENKEECAKRNTLEHKVPVLAPSYGSLQINIQFRHDDKLIELNKETGEAAIFKARMLNHTYYTRRIFIDKVFKDFRKTMNMDEERNNIKEEKKPLRK